MPLSRESLRHERAVLTSPYALKAWLAYLAHVTTSEAGISPASVISVFERSVAALPSSYKLWRQYSRYVNTLSATAHPSHPAREHSLLVFVRAARALPHCPVLWEDAVNALTRERRWTRLHTVIDESIAALPVTLHGRLWRSIVRAVLKEAKFLEFGAQVLTRARMLNVGGDGAVELFRVLRDVGKVDEAVLVLSQALFSVDGFGGDDRRDLWSELVDVAVRNPGKCTSTDVPALVRGAISKAEAEVGELWAALASLYARMALFRDAREVYEEALASVMTVRDFAVVFDAYAKFLESLVVAAMEEDSDEESDSNSGGYSDEEDIDAKERRNDRDETEEKLELAISVGRNESNGTASAEKVVSRDGADAEADVELNPEELLAALETLTNRRPMLLSDVWLRQNPHNVHEWHKRAGLLKKAGDSAGAVSVYTESVRTVDAWRATHGKPHTLWLAFAGLYEKAGDLESTRKVFDKAVSNPEKFKAADDLAGIWCEYAEMELRHGSPNLARAVLERATAKPAGFDSRKFGKSRGARAKGSPPAKKGVLSRDATAAIGTGAGHIAIAHDYDLSSPSWFAWKSLRVWSLYADIVESIGSMKDVIGIHESMLELKIATAQTVVNGAAFLESRRHFEQAFRLLDRGTTAFGWEEARRIWMLYLQKFSARYGGSKLERLRDLFEEALKAAPVKRVAGNQTVQSEHLRALYLMYASAEERFGLARHAMSIYARAAKSVLPAQQADVYRLYIVRASELFGVTRAREVYEAAISSLERREDIMTFSLRYAKMETRMGEIDRARAIYAYGAQVADPRGGAVFGAYWAAWNAFELDQGSEDTFRDMLRVKRSVQMQNAGVHLVTSVAAGAGTIEAAAAAESDRQATIANANEGEADHSTGGAMAALEKKVLEAQAAAGNNGHVTGQANAEEIDVDLDGDDDDDDNDDDSGDDASKQGVENEGAGDGCEQEATTGGNSTSKMPDIAAADDVGNKKTAENIDFEELAVPEAIMSLAGVSATAEEESIVARAKRKSGAVDAIEPAKTALGAKEKLKRLKRG